MIGYSLAPAGLPSWSGENWYMTRTAAASIAVIERPSETYDQFHERRKREEGARRVPFGFARALEAESDVPA